MLTSLFILVEIVLAMLLSKFTFAPSGKEIRWNIGGILYPTVGMDTRPAMPLKVGFVKTA